MREKSYKNFRNNNSQPNITRGGETQVMKKILNSILVFVLVLTMAVPAFAAVPSDVEGTEYEDAAARLGSLGVMIGDDQGFRPNDTLKRVELAAIAVRLLGLEDAAKVASGAASQFSDVYAGYWGEGYLTVAIQQGLLKGYGDGTLRPENPVTQAEALTILVRVLGYGPVAEKQGTWPANYIAWGAQLGVTEDLALAANAPANRGLVALMANASLDSNVAKITGFDEDGSPTYGVSNESLLENKLKLSKVTIKVAETGALLNSELEADEVLSDGGNTYTLMDSNVDIADLVGKEIEAWVKNDAIYTVAAVNTELTEDEIDRATVGNNDDSIEIDGDVYTLTQDTVVVVNNVLFEDGTDFDDLTVDSAVKLNAAFEADKNDELQTLIVTAASVGGLFEDEDGDEISLKTDMNIVEVTSSKVVVTSTDNVDFDDYDEVMGYEDLEENDVVYGFLYDDVLYLTGYNNTVVGELDEIEYDGANASTITIDGEEYDLASSYYFSLDGGELVSNATIEDYAGEEVTAHLNLDDEVVLVVAEVEVEVADPNTYLLYDVAVGTFSEVYLRVVDGEGNLQDYKVVEDAEINGNTVLSTDLEADIEGYLGFNPGDIMLISMDLDGSNVDTVEDVTLYTALGADATLYESTNRVKDDNGNTIKVDDETVIYDYSAGKVDEIEILTWDDLVSYDSFEAFVSVDNNAIIVDAIVDASSDEEVYGLLTKKGYSGGEEFIEVTYNNGTNTYWVGDINNFSSLTANTVVFVEYYEDEDGDFVSDTVTTQTSVASDVYLATVNATNMTIVDENSNSYVLADGAMVFDATDDYAEVDFDDLKEYTSVSNEKYHTVDIYTDATTGEVVVIIVKSTVTNP